MKKEDKSWLIFGIFAGLIGGFISNLFVGFSLNLINKQLTMVNLIGAFGFAILFILFLIKLWSWIK